MFQRIFSLFVLTATVVLAQAGRITLVAGGVPLGEGRPATEAQFWYVGAIAAHPQGGLVVAADQTRIIHFDSAGTMRTLGGAQWFGNSGDNGPATSATFGLDFWRAAPGNSVRGGIAVDEQGSVYIAQTGNNRIRRIDPDGIVRPFAGNGALGSAGDGGPAPSAQIEHPAGLTCGRDGALFIAQPDNHRIRRIDPNGTITTFAGDGTARPADGSGGALDQKRVTRPEFIAVDSKGNVYVSDSDAHVVRRISPDGTVHAFAGTGRAAFSGDGGSALQAHLSSPGPLAVDAEDRVYIADRNNNRVRVVSAEGVITTVAGRGGAVTSDTGPALQAGLSFITGLSVSATRRIFVAEGFNVFRIRVIEPSGEISLYGGATPFAGLDGPAPYARVEAAEVAIDKNGNFFITGPDYIRKVDGSGRISHFAGRPGGIVPRDSPVPASEAHLGSMIAAQFDPEGRLVVLDRFGRVLRIGKDGMVSLLAGAFERGFAGDGGPGWQARFNSPSDLAVDADGAIYVADELNYRIRRIDVDGTVSTIAGTGAAGSGGDGGPATRATLRPAHVDVEPNGDLLVVERDMHLIRRISKKDGRITKAVGDGTCASNDLAQGKICLPGRSAIGPAGEIYNAGNGRVVRLTPSGGKDVLTPFGWRAAQSNPVAFGAYPLTPVVSPAGDLLFVTAWDAKVWKVQGNGPFLATPSGLLFSFSLGAPPASQIIALETGDNNIKPYEITSSAPWLTVSPATGKLEPGLPTNLRVTADPKGLTKGSYTAKLTVRNPEDQAQRLEITVSITVSGTPQQMRLSQTGFAFAAVPNGAVTSPRALQVLNTGIGSMPWRATTTTLAGGNWLQVSPDAGTSEAGRLAPEVRITANPTGLAPGVYFGLVNVGATGVDNAPQSATIILNVTAQNQPPGAIIEPAGLLFATGLLDPAPAQQAQLANLTSGEVTYALALAFPKDSPTWATITAPTTGRVAAGATARLEVKPNIQGLKPGVYTADLQVTVNNERTPRIVNLVLVLANSTVSSKARAAEGCAGTKLVPVFASPVAASQSPTGWPTSVSVKIVDDCAQPLTEGRVSVSFSNGDPSLALVSEGNGRWSGTWAARNANARVTLTATARSATSPPIDGTGRLDVGVRADTVRPLIAPGGIRSLASQLEGRPVAMASPVLILGSQLVPEAGKAAVSPLPTEIKGTSALIAGKFLRLSSVAADRLEAVLPAGIADSTPLQVIVKRGTTYSVPETVIVAQAQPEIFTAGGTGVGQGMVYTFEEGGKRWLADSERPLKPGDRVFILCAGLGPVDRPLADGAPAPDSGPPQVVNPVAVTIQNQSAEQVTAYLAPGMVGMYWVTATVPNGLKPDVTADVVVKVGDGASPPVTAAVRPPVEP